MYINEAWEIFIEYNILYANNEQFDMRYPIHV